MILDILTQTDFAGAIEETYHCPGAARLAALLSRQRKENPSGTLFLDAGDVLCGAPICNLTAGEPVIDMLNRLGVDAMTLGNHEFDNGRESMHAVLQRANFPILCANILDAASQRVLPFAAPYVMLERQGIHIGIIGVTTAYTPFMVKQDRFTDYTVVSPAKVLNVLVPRLRREGADIIIVLSHLPGSVTSEGVCTGELFEVAGEIPPVDVLIGGHNFGSFAFVRGETVFAKAGFSANDIAHIRLVLDANKRVRSRKARLYRLLGAEAEPLQPRTDIQLAVDRAMAPYRPALNEALAELPAALSVDSQCECALGNFYTDALRKAANAEVGVFNATSMYGYMPAGTVTAEMVQHVMCFDEDIFAGTMRGLQLKCLFERTYETGHWAMNRALQFSGLRVEVDTRKPEGQRVCSIRLEDGRPLRPDSYVRIATTDYIASGGNNYQDIMKQTAWVNTHIRTHTYFVDYLRDRRVIPHQTDGRLLNLDPDWPCDDAAAKKDDANGSPG